MGIYYTKNERNGVYNELPTSRTDEELIANRQRAEAIGTQAAYGRTAQIGTAKADETFLSNAAYSDMQKYKNDFAYAQQQYDAAKAQGAGDNILQEYQRQMDAAHAGAEALRANAGYSGGTDGSQYLVRYSQNDAGGNGYGGSGGGRGSGSYNSDPFVSKYQAQIDALTAALLNRPAFSYNALTDPAYQQYQESYTKGGQRGMQDTLGQVSARTGGMASSWSQNAAQQTYDNYMAALADKIPELRQLAYSMYMDEGNTMRNNLSMLMNLDNTDYSRYSNDRSFNYNAYRDSVADSQWNQNFNYNAMQNALANDLNAQKASDAKQETLAKLLAQMTGDYTAYGNYLGANSDQIAALNSAVAAANAPKYTGGGGGNTGGNTGGGTGGTITDVSQLGNYALNIASQMAKSNSTNNVKSFAEKISNGLNNGVINDAEADFLMRALGY